MSQRFAAFVVSNLFLGWSQTSDVSIRGVSPQNQVKYACQNDPCTFTCFSGEIDPMPYQVVNDDFCDCPDGSDEPGTAACAGQSSTLFYCVNELAVPKLLYASQISDGICDCCDGSDEKGADSGAQFCNNTCEEEGKNRAELLDRLKRGLEQLRVVRRDAKNARQRWRTEVEKLKSELPQLEKALEEAKIAQIPPAVASRFDDMMKLIEELRAEVREQRTQLQDLQLQQDELRTENNKLKDMIANGPQVQSAVKQEAASDQGKQVSEYAKWMDNAAGMLQEKQNAAATEDKKQPLNTRMSLPATIEPAKSVDKESVTQESNASNSTDLEQLQKDTDSNKAKTSELDAQISFWTDDRIGYYSLMDKCLEETVGEFKYKVCFFKNAQQGSLSVGKWSGWQGPRQATFKGGQSCSGGIEREMVVKFQCGADEKIVSVAETTRCFYEATVIAPGACGKKSKQAIEQAAAHEVPQPRHPKDEL